MKDRKLNSDETHNLVDAVLKPIFLKHQPAPETDIDSLLRRFKADVLTVRPLVQAVHDAAMTSQVAHNRQTLSKDAARFMLERVINYNRDELMLILATMCGDVLAEEVL